MRAQHEHDRGLGATASWGERSGEYWLDKSGIVQDGCHWVSDHPAYKVEITVNGDRGTLHFECHYVDIENDDVASVTPCDLGRGADRREVADHEHGRRDDRRWKSEPMSDAR